jgi:hypothetical protein
MAHCVLSTVGLVIRQLNTNTNTNTNFIRRNGARPSCCVALVAVRASIRNKGKGKGWFQFPLSPLTFEHLGEEVEGAGGPNNKVRWHHHDHRAVFSTGMV